MLGLITIFLILGSGCWLARRGLSLPNLVEAGSIGMALAVTLYLLFLSLGLQAGMTLQTAVFTAPLPLLALAALTGRRPDAQRTGPILGRMECALLLLAMLAAWCYLNLMQVITVDDDYWMHTPVQGRMLRGVIPPTNPFFPELVLGGHYGRDTLVVAISRLTGRDIWGAQVLLTSFSAALGLGVLYLAVRRCGSAAQATSAVFLAWLGANVAFRCGLADFYQNNGGPTYLVLALLIFLFVELWRQPGRKLAVLCGLVLGVYATIYETHFGLVGLTVLTLLPWLDRPAKLASLLSLVIAGTLAVSGGGALSRISRDTPKLDLSVANQSQSVQLSFPKSPFLCLQIQTGEIEPVSCGYQIGLGKPLLAAIDHPPGKVNDRYVRLWSWMVLRMHWLGLYLAPFSAWMVFARGHRAGQFLLVFAAWAYLVPGMVDFGPIHEYEWFRWEFAAGYGFAAALGVALGGLAKTRKGWALLALALALIANFGLEFVRQRIMLIGNPTPAEVLGWRFHSTDYILRHGEFLRTRASDLRTLAWLDANSGLGNGALLATTGPQEPWGILFESTAMGLADVRALGHALPDPKVPVGVPPFRLGEDFWEILYQADVEEARRRGIDWILLRSDDWITEKNLLEKFRLVSYDTLSSDGKRRLLLTTLTQPLRPPAVRQGATFTYPLPSASFVDLLLDELPVGTREIGVCFVDGEDFLIGPPATLPPFRSVNLAVPSGCRVVELRFIGPRGELLELRAFPPAAKVKNPPLATPRNTMGTRPLPDERLQ